MFTRLALAAVAFSAVLFAAEGDLSPVAMVFDRGITGVEKEVVSLAEAMPADEYNFAPNKGSFQGVRTFGQQVRHIAAVNLALAASIKGDTQPVDTGKNENGPAAMNAKADSVAYLKESFAALHNAMKTVTAENLMTPVKSAFGKNMVPRLNMLTIPVSHSFDHYGQMVVYARMNNVVPPASR